MSPTSTIFKCTLRSRNSCASWQSLAGPWTSQQDIAPEATRTWYSQNAFDLPLGANAIYMGDRWRPDLLGSSRYIWYPLDFSSGAPQIVHADVWSVDLQAGVCVVCESGVLGSDGLDCAQERIRSRAGRRTRLKTECSAGPRLSCRTLVSLVGKAWDTSVRIQDRSCEV